MITWKGFETERGYALIGNPVTLTPYLTETVLAKLWDNEDDAAYDDMVIR